MKMYLAGKIIPSVRTISTEVHPSASLANRLIFLIAFIFIKKQLQAVVLSKTCIIILITGDLWTLWLPPAHLYQINLLLCGNALRPRRLTVGTWSSILYIVPHIRNVSRFIGRAIIIVINSHVLLLCSKRGSQLLQDHPHRNLLVNILLNHHACSPPTFDP